MNFVELSDQINEYFNAEELADLCFRLGIQYENLAGATNSAKVRELTDYCRRHGRVENLIAVCRDRRPHVLWVMPDPTPDNTSGQTAVFGNPPSGTAGMNIPTAMPGSPQPPQVPGMFWMMYPNTWYGPFYGYFIGWMVIGGFQVWHPMMGAIVYPDPYHQLQRNIWVRLFNSPFNVFVDGSSNGYVYGQYSPI